MKIAILASALILSLAGTAYAGSEMTFEEIREACLDPGKYHNQKAPTNLQISCEERGTHWVDDGGSAVELQRTREVIASLTSDKYSVAPMVRPLSMESQQGTCPHFKEVMEMVNFTKATSCDEILGFQGDAIEFCTDILDRAKEANPDLVQMKDTGNVMDLCGEKGQDQGQDKGQGNKNRKQRHPSSVVLSGQRDQKDQGQDKGQDQGEDKGQDQGQDEGQDQGQDRGQKDQGRQQK